MEKEKEEEKEEKEEKEEDKVLVVPDRVSGERGEHPRSVCAHNAGTKQQKSVVSPVVR